MRGWWLTAILREHRYKSLHPLGVSTVAIVGDEETIWTHAAVELTSKQKKLRKLQRKMERGRRANNPDNFNKNPAIAKF